MQPRTQQDDYNLLIAMAFEEKVNAQAKVHQMQQKLQLAVDSIEKLRQDVKDRDARIAELTRPVPVLTEGDAGADLVGTPRPDNPSVPAA